jgi:hypothetical protein
MAGFGALATMMRSAHALSLLERPVIAQERVKASRELIQEYQNFVGHPDGRARITFDQFQRFAQIFAPLNTDHELLTLVCLEVVYSDIAKLSSMREVLASNLGIDTSDHDVALGQAFTHPQFDRIAEYFPSLQTIPEEVYTTLQGNLTSSFNIGAMLQIEVPAAVSRPLGEFAAHHHHAVTGWFLASLADIFGARAEENDPASWHTSRLVNDTLAENLLEVARNLTILSHKESALTFFDTLHAAIYAREYYRPLRETPLLPDDEKQTVYRLCRFLSFELDARPLDDLIHHWTVLNPSQKALLTGFLNNSGLDSESPRPVVTYLPYLFNRLYARHLPLNEALGRFLGDMSGILGQLKATNRETRWAHEEDGAGYYTVSCQDTWRYSLQHLRGEDLQERRLHFAITITNKGRPEVVLQDELLLRDELARVRLLATLETAAHEAEAVCKEILVQQLNDTERELLDWVQGFPFIEGSWYRPIHNLIVPMAMVSICRETEAPRFLVIPAIVHDVGYTALEIPGTLQGAAWATASVREGHQLASKEMSKPKLTQLRSEGKLQLSEQTLSHILEIVATHDNPYIGKPLIDPLAKLHRDADRSFVISCVSFWKDYLAYLSDEKRVQLFACRGAQLTPDTFLRAREVSFEDDPLSPLRDLTSFEPMTSPEGQRIVNKQRSLRAEEMPTVLALLSRTDESADLELKSYLRERIVQEFMILADQESSDARRL